MLKNPWICGACKSTTSARSAPAVVNRSATSFDEIGTRGLSLRSCRAYPKYGITTVIRRAEARFSASISSSNCIRCRSTGSHVGCTMNTSAQQLYFYRPDKRGCIADRKREFGDVAERNLHRHADEYTILFI